MSPGFTDRRGINDPSPGAAVAPDAALPVTLVLNLIERRPLSILVADTTGLGTSCWLPRSKISVEPGRGRVIRVSLPRWLAREKGLLSEPGEGQGALF